MAFAIRADVADPQASTFTFIAEKTMYDGRRIAEGDTVFVFGRAQGLLARGVVTCAEAVAKNPAISRQTPRVTVSVRRVALVRRPLGRDGVGHLADWNDGQPGTEINFKFYRQATNKIAGISGDAAKFLDAFF